MDGSYTDFVGIDVSKATLDVFLASAKTELSCPNDQGGFEKILAQLPEPKTCLIVVESTGIYHQALVAALLDKDHDVAVVNPGRVREFAKGLGKLAKTDRIDARILARFGELTLPRLAPKTPDRQGELSQLLARRRQLVELRKLEKQHLESTTIKTIAKTINKNIEKLTEQIKKVEAMLTQAVEANDELKAKSDILKSVPGIGDVMAFTILADLPELGLLSHGEISALVGVAPYNCDSGAQRGGRHIRGGRARIRSTLYMATVCAMRCNYAIETFATRLKAANKPFKVILVACMRKMLGILNAMLKSETAWIIKNER
jgi:transposase